MVEEVAWDPQHHPVFGLRFGRNKDSMALVVSLPLVDQRLTALWFDHV